MILFIKNISIEGPETLGDFFLSKGYPVKVVDMGHGGLLPKDTAGIDAVIVLGGPMNVYEEDKYPFLREEDAFIRKVIDVNLPFLGVCLGSQLLAKACGAKVSKAPHKEVGWSSVDLTPEGEGDPLFEGVSSAFDVFQWHEDTFDVPQGGVLLAESKLCAHQAFRFGSNAYGLQFHIEITPVCIEAWARAYFPEKDNKERKIDQLVLGYAKRQEKFQNTSNQVYNNFLQLIEENRQKTTD